MKKIFFGNTQNFDEIIRSDMIYVDKTRHIHKLLSNPQAYFLCRPRGFGKSLFLDAIDKALSGERELFEGLWLDSSDWEFKKTPVIRLSMDFAQTSPGGELNKRIMEALEEIAKNFQIEVRNESLDVLFSSLVRNLSAERQSKVAILVDEYDAPVMDHIEEPGLARSNLETLAGFYRLINQLSKHIGFVFVTGVTQLARVGLGQSSANLVDISLDPEFADVCGFTHEELDRYFGIYYLDTLETMIKRRRMNPKDDVEDLLNRILAWYGGYSFDEFAPYSQAIQRVLNPFSILNFFAKARFENYWVNAGNSMFLSRMISRQPKSYLELDLKNVDSTTLSSLDFAELNNIALLFQTGYLTLDRVKMTPGRGRVGLVRTLVLREANKEAREALRKSLLLSIFGIKAQHVSTIAETLRRAVVSRDAQTLARIFSDALERLSGHESVPLGKYCLSGLHMFIYGLGFSSKRVFSSARARSKLRISLSRDVQAIIEVEYVAEMSANVSKEEKKKLMGDLADASVKRIDDDDFGDQSRKAVKDLVKIGLAIHYRGDVAVTVAPPKASRGK
ncbi:MAG: AAA family ATPase [Deltaproteobacteria bacterium]|jgi:hypothetical protein|nr:AAA family ATPase [Deltaproteobacteria bacterium]